MIELASVTQSSLDLAQLTNLRTFKSVIYNVAIKRCVCLSVKIIINALSNFFCAPKSLIVSS
jgi:hypothetical protein